VGCPYIDNSVGRIRCPRCGGTRITAESKKAPFGCVCEDCGHVLCYTPKC